MAERSSREIRDSIEANRLELARSLEKLRAEVTEATNWRKQIARHRTPVLVGAAATGFLLGGGIAGVFGLFSRR